MQTMLRTEPAVSSWDHGGDNRTEFVKVEFTSADDGSGVVLIPGENGELDFAVLEGKYIVTVTNDNGEEIGDSYIRGFIQYLELSDGLLSIDAEEAIRAAKRRFPACHAKSPTL